MPVYERDDPYVPFACMRRAKERRRGMLRVAIITAACSAVVALCIVIHGRGCPSGGGNHECVKQDITSVRHHGMPSLLADGAKGLSSNALIARVERLHEEFLADPSVPQ